MSNIAFCTKCGEMYCVPDFCYPNANNLHICKTTIAKPKGVNNMYTYTKSNKTLLDEFALAALPEIIKVAFKGDIPHNETAKRAYDIAEAMLAEKLKREGKND